MIIYYLEWRRANGAGPNTLKKEYCGIKGIMRILKHKFIDYKKGEWDIADKWIKNNLKGHEPETAPEFTMYHMHLLKNYPDPENKFFMLKLCAFFGLNLRLRAIEYTRILFEQISILIQGMFLISSLFLFQFISVIIYFFFN